MAERPNARLLKSLGGDPRGFESRSLRPAGRRSLISRMVRPLLLLLLVAVSAHACTPDGEPLQVPSARAPTQEELSKPPYEGPVEVGKRYTYLLFTHCGVPGTEIGGTWWEATRVDPPSGRPGNGLGGYVEGELRLERPNRAVFSSEHLKVTFRRTDNAPPELGCL